MRTLSPLVLTLIDRYKLHHRQWTVVTKHRIVWSATDTGRAVVFEAPVIHAEYHVFLHFTHQNIFRAPHSMIIDSIHEMACMFCVPGQWCQHRDWSRRLAKSIISVPSVAPNSPHIQTMRRESHRPRREHLF